MRHRLLLLLAGAFAPLLVIPLAPLPIRTRPQSTVVLDRASRALGAFVASDGRWRLPVDRARLPSRLSDGLLAFEDRRFRWHPGVDPAALLRASIQNLFAGEVVSGGSTLTMQVARMLEPRPRTLRSKAIEMFRALQLTWHYDKDEILALYFELAPYGGNIEGIEAAALLYYGKSPRDLSLDEMATLIALPNAPERLRPDRQLHGRSRLKARRDDVLQRMEDAGLISAAERERSAALSIHAERRTPPQLAPQVAERFRQRGQPVHTTIDADLQQLADDHLRHRIEQLGFGAGGVVIIDNASRAVRAQVGFARSLRSPGSTLKPFAYALGFDRGAIGLRTLLEDVPRDYGGWTPSNFDGRWRGLVPVQDALQESLNAPAVELVSSLGQRSLIDLLARAGFTTFDGTRDYGLSVVLGGCEVDLLELTNLYATLASGGRHAAPRFTEGTTGTTVQLFSEEAAFMVTEILRAAPRRDSARALAFKTGTSYGRRDAWSVGYDPRFTVGVWLGNLDARGAPELVGIEAAAPLLFAIAGALPSGPGFQRPAGIVEREVCALSGEAPLPGVCPHVIPTLVAAQVPQRPCTHHRELTIDRESGVLRCERCRVGRRSMLRAVYRVLPPRVQAWLTARGEAPPPLPVHDPMCTARAHGDPPAIESPKDGDVYRLRRGFSDRSQRIELVASAPDQLWWFLDGELLERSPPGRPVLIDPIPGSHQIAAVDDEGRTAQVRFTVLPAR